MSEAPYPTQRRRYAIPINRTIDKKQYDGRLEKQHRDRDEEKRRAEIMRIHDVLQGFYPVKYKNYVEHAGTREMTFKEECLTDTGFLIFIYDTCIAVFNDLVEFNIVYQEIAANILYKNKKFLKGALGEIDVCGNLEKIREQYRLQANTDHDLNTELKNRYLELITKFEELVLYAKKEGLCMTSERGVRLKTTSLEAVPGEGSEAGSAHGGKKRHAMNKQTKKRRSKKRTSTRRRQRKNIRK
jgi:hypothetical protein